MHIPARIRALRTLLRRESLPAILVSNPLNLRYLTGLELSEGLLLVTRTLAFLCVDSRYGEVAVESGLWVVDIGDMPGLLKGISRCAFEEEHVTVRRLARWKSLFKNTKFIQSFDLAEGLRRKKDSQEIRLMRKARALTVALLRQVPHWLRRGVTEREVAWQLECFARELGADGLAFPAIVAFGKNSSRPHHRTTAKTLRLGELVQIDVGVRYKGYAADMSRVFAFGDIPVRARHAVRAVQRAYDAAAAKAKRGVLCSELDAAARKVLLEAGIPEEHLYGHALGHGVGLDVHEGPRLSFKSTDRLKAGDVIAIEPGVYVPGQFGVRIEDTVFVK